MTSALVVIDVQESFRRRPTWQVVSNPDIADDVQRLVDAARAAGDLVVWVLHAEPGTGSVFDPAGGLVRLVDGLVPLDGEPILTKTSRNAFTTTNLAQLLTERGIRELVVCGIQTEQCCETTARVAADLGYDVTFVVDATATFPIAHRDAPGRPDRGRAGRRPQHTADGRHHRPHRVCAGRPLRHRPHGRRADQIVTRVVFVLMPRLHLLDLAGPAQVFSTATDFGHPYQLSYVGAEPVVATHQGVPLGASVDLPPLARDDLVVVPGWRSPLASAAVTPDLLAFCAPTTRPAARWPACAPGRTRSAGPGCSTAAAAPPTTTCRTSWPGATRGRVWCATCSTSRTTG